MYPNTICIIAFSIFIAKIYRIIGTIRKHVAFEELGNISRYDPIGVDEPAVGKVVVPALEVVKARFAVVVVTAVTQGVNVPDEGGGGVLLTVCIVHGVVAPRAVGTAAQRDTADNDNDLWLCADGCTHHSDHLSISLRAVHQHRPLTESPIFRATGRNFSLFCHSIRPLNAALAMVKALFRIAGQISIFYRKKRGGDVRESRSLQPPPPDTNYL